MPKKLIRTGVRTGATKTYEAKVTCASCGGKISSLDGNCPNCGATRKVLYTADEVGPKGPKITGPELERVRSGAKNCPHCGSLEFNFDAARNQYVCENCGGNSGVISDYEIAGGEVSKPDPEPIRQIPLTPYPAKAKSLSQTQMLAFGAGGLVLITLLIWLFSAMFTTHEVPGTVTAVSWQITSHQEEYVQKTGEGWSIPTGAEEIRHDSRIADYADNIVGYEYGEYTVKSTPEVAYYDYADIPIETPGAITTSEPYDCGEPTIEAGGSVTYEQCVDVYQEDSTYGWGKSDPTPVYAPQVDVLMTTEPTPIYGTPTPVFENYFYYIYWDWTSVGEPVTNIGSDNFPYTLTASDDSYRIVIDEQVYKVEVTYSNGHVETYEGSDPGLLQKYVFGSPVIGKFNRFDGFSGDIMNQTLP